MPKAANSSGIGLEMLCLCSIFKDATLSANMSMAVCSKFLTPLNGDTGILFTLENPNELRLEKQGLYVIAILTNLLLAFHYELFLIATFRQKK